jgi:DNA-binding beta-propeller fold protein YncE
MSSGNIYSLEKGALVRQSKIAFKYYKSSFLLCFLLSTILMTFVTPALAIKLINVRPVFDLADKLNMPSDVAVSRDGQIYVVDGVNHKIRVFDQQGKLISSFGSKGSADGEFSSPLGIDIDSSGRLYIADSGNHRVQIFGPNQDFIAKIMLPSKNDHPADPTDVVVDESRNRCYIVDNDNHYVLAYDLSTLELIRSYGASGTDKLAFRYPFFIALDKEKRLYIVDVINTRVQVLSHDGQLVAIIGGWGVEKGEFFRPKGVAVDRKGRVYVSDSYLGVIQVFDSSGEFQAALGDPQTGKVKKFRGPTGLFVDHHDKLYVVEMSANQVSVYRTVGDSE